MAKDMVTARASKGGHKGAGKKRHVKHMHITPSKNGGAAIETHFHAPKKSGDANDVAAPYEAPPEPEMHTTGSPEETGAHVASMLQTGYPVGGDQDGDEGATPAE